MTTIEPSAVPSLAAGCRLSPNAGEDAMLLIPEGALRLVGPALEIDIDAGVAVFAAQVRALLDRPEVESVLPTIRCPVLVAVGSEDIWSPVSQHVAIAGAIPQAKLTIVTGAGHMLPAEDPSALNAAIAAWLAQPTHH